ncbi:MAG: TIGR04282 family arsenosugar biosynthesis glycosyltransferase [Saprospiraceae bacterium]
MERGLLIFIKNPQLGKAKTRLATSIGKEKALEVYKELLNHTRKVVKEVDARRMVFYSSFINKEDQWTSDLFEKHLQTGLDLGDRMKNGFEEGFKKAAPLIIIGSDCAQLSPEIIEKAFEKLKDYDFVIGPAEDGGYYLLGMNSFQPFVFEQINWSTEKVAEQTRQRILSLGMTVAEVDTLSDVDELEDLEKVEWLKSAIGR